MSHVDEGSLHAYLDGELSSSERAAVEAHVAACADCRANLAEAKALTSRASDILGRAAPTEHPLPAMPRRRRLVRVPFAWAATVVLALGIGYYLHAPGSPVAPAPQPVVMAPNRSTGTNTPVEEKPELRQLQRRRDARSLRSREEVATADKSRVSDSLPAIIAQRFTTGAVATQPSTQLRGAAPVRASAPAAPSALQVQDAIVRADSLAGLVGRLVSSQWTVISKGSARTLLGADPVGIPGLTARDIRRSPTDAATIVVEQQLDATTVIQLFQRPATADDSPLGYVAPSNAQAERAPAERLARYVGRLRVEITGPLTQDSLNRLLEQVKPLP